MKIYKTAYFSLFIILLSCKMNDNTRSYHLAKNNKPKTTDIEKLNRDKSTKLIWEKPKSWIPSEGSSMRLASFSVPYFQGNGDLSVIQLGGNGGGLESNVNRWRQQLDLGPLSLNEIEKNIISKEGKLSTYSMIEIVNHEMESAFICAIITTSSYTIFVKLAISSKGIPEVKDDFIIFCSSLNIPK